MHAKSQVSLIRAEDGRCRSSHAHQPVVITPIAQGAAPRADVVADGSMICCPVELHRLQLAEIAQVFCFFAPSAEDGCLRSEHW